MIDRILDLLFNYFDLGYMFSVNILTYVLIKIVDHLNKDKAVPVWLKRTIAVLCGLTVGTIIVIFNGFSNTLIYSFILSLVSWDSVFKPIIKRFENADYKKDQNERNI